MYRNTIVAALFLSVCLSCPTVSALSEAEYNALSGFAKRDHNRREARRTRYSKVPGNLWQSCGAGIAGIGLFARNYSQNIMNWNGPVASRFWRGFRELTGKPIHRYGVTASASVTLRAGTGLLYGTRIPATVRYSLAGPYSPTLESLFNSGVGNYHPGWMISFHVDGQPDLNLVIMPKNGLDGFDVRGNPFDQIYTHKIEAPEKWGVRLAAVSTFSRFVTDPMSQELGPFASVTPNGLETQYSEFPEQLHFNPDAGIKARFEAAAFGLSLSDGSSVASLADVKRDDREILADLPYVTPYQIFDIKNGADSVGQVEINSAFILNHYGDRRYITHPGFTPK